MSHRIWRAVLASWLGNIDRSEAFEPIDLAGLVGRGRACEDRARMERHFRTEILEAVMEFCVGHAYFQLLQSVGIVRLKVEAHLCEPFEVVRRIDFLVDQRTSDVSLVYVFNDLDRQSVLEGIGARQEHAVRPDVPIFVVGQSADPPELDRLACRVSIPSVAILFATPCSSLDLADVP